MTAEAKDVILLDTSAVIDIDLIDFTPLPAVHAITTITLAELAVGPLMASDPIARELRQRRLQWASLTFDALAFDEVAALAFGQVWAHAAAGRGNPRRRVADLQIAAIALANELPLATRNPDDFTDLGGLTVVPV